MSQQPERIHKKFHIDRTLMFLLLAMTCVSLLAIYCADPIMATRLQGTHLWLKQGMWYAIGFLMLALLTRFGSDRLFTGVKIFYWILMVLLAILLVDKYLINLPDRFIRPVNGTTAWYQIPGLGTFQPSEFMKVVLIIMVANIIHEHNLGKTEMSFASDFKLFWKVGKIAVPPLILIFLEPDTGIPLIIIVSILVMLAVSGVRKEWVWLGAACLVIGFGGLIFMFKFYPNLLSSILGGGYKMRRIYGWLETEKYINTWGNQLYTSLLTIGSSGLTGHGFREVLIRFPEPQTDFIFSVIGQNFGFLGTTSVVALLTAFDLKLISIASRHDQPRERYMVAGMIGMLLFQQLVNMGMITGLFPITGITLPFISYGGSSMLSYMIPLAIVFQMSSENKSRLMH